MKTNKELMHKLQENDGTWFYTVKEVQDQSGAWQSRQAEVDEKDKRIAELTGLITDALEAFEDGSFNYCQSRLVKALRGDDE